MLMTLSLPSDYSATYGAALQIPILVDPDLPLSADFESGFKTDTPFSVSLEEAILCADRHLRVFGRGDWLTVAAEIENWRNVLRWNLCTFWTCDPASNSFDTTSRFSAEHPKWMGELLAEGLALRLLEKRLHLPSSKFFFYSGAEARPDFVARPPAWFSRAFLDGKRRRFGLECRIRRGWASIHASDRAEIARKKLGKFSGVLAIYSAYGPPSPKRASARTRLILGDPEGDEGPISFLEVVRVLVHHYSGVTERLGLWAHRDALREAWEQLESGEVPPPRVDPGSGQDGPLNSKSFGEEEYSGRFFSALMLQQHTGRITDREARDRIRAEDFGALFYQGINTRLLRSLRTFEWEAVEAFFDENALLRPDIGSDGVVRAQLPAEDEDYDIVAEATRSALS